ncbi:MAG: hypothetical protein NTZ56_21760 [Acidobacteria bacterium]|nr:hypothetical protein [Acidobacteriota bacterium]
MHLDEIDRRVLGREREILAGPLQQGRAQELITEGLLLSAEIEEHRHVILKELESLDRQENLALALGQALEPSGGRAALVDVAG